MGGLTGWGAREPCQYCGNGHKRRSPPTGHSWERHINNPGPGRASKQGGGLQGLGRHLLAALGATRPHNCVILPNLIHKQCVRELQTNSSVILEPCVCKYVCARNLKLCKCLEILLPMSSLHSKTTAMSRDKSWGNEGEGAVPRVSSLDSYLIVASDTPTYGWHPQPLHQASDPGFI